MRQIKFRVWDEVAERMEFNIDPRIKDGSLHVMQYTGLNDKKGIEIYEGDIIKLETYWKEEDDHMKSIWEVEWHDAGFVLMEKGDFRTEIAGENEKIEVIGNIYQNPKLI